MSGEPWPNYGQHGWDADDEEIRSPPTTHFVATIDDLTDMLDFDPEDIDGMDDDAGDEQEPAPVGRWKATSSYDIYMVDTPKEGDGDKTEDKTPGQKPKRRRRRCSKSSHSKHSDNRARKIDTPVNSKGNNDHMGPAMEQEEPGNTEHSPE